MRQGIAEVMDLNMSMSSLAAQSCVVLIVDSSVHMRASALVLVVIVAHCVSFCSCGVLLCGVNRLCCVWGDGTDVVGLAMWTSGVALVSRKPHSRPEYCFDSCPKGIGCCRQSASPILLTCMLRHLILIDPSPPSVLRCLVRSSSFPELPAFFMSSTKTQKGSHDVP